MTRGYEGYLAATAAVVVAYLIAAWARREAGGGTWSWNALVITRGVHARASLSKLQLFFFSLVVIWVVAAYLVWTGKLTGLSADVLVLLGIGAVGTAGGKAIAVRKKRPTYENWAWLKKKGWIEESIEPEDKTRVPQFGDLFRSGNEFDITKFQMFAFSLIVGAALVYFVATGDIANAKAGLADYDIPDAYLALIGLSQVVYIGGKAVAPGTVNELNAKLKEVRGLEVKFVDAVSTKWTAGGAPAAGSSNDLRVAAARQAEPSAYAAYRLKAEEAATMVRDLTANDITDAMIEPTVPKSN